MNAPPLVSNSRSTAGPTASGRDTTFESKRQRMALDAACDMSLLSALRKDEMI